MGSIAVLGALVAGPAALGSAASARGEWVQNGFDPANTHFNPHERILTRANVGQLAPSWNLAVDATGSPAVVGSTVFVQTKTAVNAYDLHTGASVWSRPLHSDLFFGSVAVAHGVVYASSTRPDVPATPILYALSAADGSRVWKLPLPNFAGSRNIVVDGRNLYLSDGNGAVLVVDAAKHRVVRTMRAPHELTAPVIADRMVYASDIYDHELYAFDEATGAIEWHVAVGTKLLLHDGDVSDGVAVVPSKDGSVYAVDAADGSPLWSFPIGAKFPGPVAIAKGVVYFGAYDGMFYARDLHTGTQRWKVSLGAQATNEPTVANGVVYITTQDKNLRALDTRTGAPLFTGLAGATSDGNIVVSNGNVLVSGATGHVRRWVLPD